MSAPLKARSKEVRIKRVCDERLDLPSSVAAGLGSWNCTVLLGFSLRTRKARVEWRPTRNTTIERKQPENKDFCPAQPVKKTKEQRGVLRRTDRGLEFGV